MPKELTNFVFNSKYKQIATMVVILFAIIYVPSISHADQEPGNVVVIKSGNYLHIRGDDKNNSIKITFFKNRDVRVSPIGPKTLINDQHKGVKVKLKKNERLSVRMNAGHDLIVVDKRSKFPTKLLSIDILLSAGKDAIFSEYDGIIKLKNHVKIDGDSDKDIVILHKTLFVAHKGVEIKKVEVLE